MLKLELEVKNLLRFYCNKSFREVCKLLINDTCPVLTDDIVAGMYIVAFSRYESRTEVFEDLPTEECREHFIKIRGGSFKRFILFKKEDDNGVLVGQGVDENYYVVLSWDRNGYDLWEPEVLFPSNR
ncbi:MAG: hypothetical protein WC694_01375 [Candidatus Paceibacterota bacterium]